MSSNLNNQDKPSFLLKLSEKAKRQIKRKSKKYLFKSEILNEQTTIKLLCSEDSKNSKKREIFTSLKNEELKDLESKKENLIENFCYEEYVEAKTKVPGNKKISFQQVLSFVEAKVNKLYPKLENVEVFIDYKVLAKRIYRKYFIFKKEIVKNVYVKTEKDTSLKYNPDLYFPLGINESWENFYVENNLTHYFINLIDIIGTIHLIIADNKNNKITPKTGMYIFTWKLFLEAYKTINSSKFLLKKEKTEIQKIFFNTFTQNIFTYKKNNKKITILMNFVEAFLPKWQFIFDGVLSEKILKGETLLNEQQEISFKFTENSTYIKKYKVFEIFQKKTIEEFLLLKGFINKKSPSESIVSNIRILIYYLKLRSMGQPKFYFEVLALPLNNFCKLIQKTYLLEKSNFKALKNFISNLKKILLILGIARILLPEELKKDSILILEIHLKAGIFSYPSMQTNLSYLETSKSKIFNQIILGDSEIEIYEKLKSNLKLPLENEVQPNLISETFK